MALASPSAGDDGDAPIDGLTEADGDGDGDVLPDTVVPVAPVVEGAPKADVAETGGGVVVSVVVAAVVALVLVVPAAGAPSSSPVASVSVALGGCGWVEGDDLKKSRTPRCAMYAGAGAPAGIAPAAAHSASSKAAVRIGVERLIVDGQLDEIWKLCCG